MPTNLPPDDLWLEFDEDDIEIEPKVNPDSVDKTRSEDAIKRSGHDRKAERDHLNGVSIIWVRIVLIILIGLMALLELITVLGSLIYLLLHNQLELLNTIAIPLGGLAFHSYKLLEKALDYHLKPWE